MSDTAANIELSVIIPVYNEEAGLTALFARLYPALDALNTRYEIVFINDGSRDRSAALLAAQHAARPDVTRAILFAANFGQHMAILAGFEHAHGQYVVTLDADLQNPPEEIGRILEQLRAGHDYVGTIRQLRQDSAWRRYASRMINRMRERSTRIHITDQGCMMRGYARNVVDAVNACREVSTFVPALAYTFAQRPTEINIRHEERFAGESKYSIYSLIRLNFDLMTGFSLLPLQFVSMAGMLLSLLSGAFVTYLFIRRLVVGPEAEGLFTLFGIAFFLIGILLFAVGLIGEYVGRIYQQVRARPRYLVQAVLETNDHPSTPRGTQP